MDSTSGVSEPILFSATAPRLWPLLVLLACLLAGYWALKLLLGPQLRARSLVAARWLLFVGLGALAVSALWAAVQLASPAVRLKATERGFTSYMRGPFSGGGMRLQLARHADADGLFIPWRAIESLRLDRLECAAGGSSAPCDVLAISLRPGFEELRARGVVVVPGVRRSTLDVPVPTPPGGTALLAELRALHQRFGNR